MRKIAAWLYLSLDGVVEATETWALSFSDDEMERENRSGMAASDALLLGRVTYEHLAAYWPHQPNDVPVAKHLNETPKFVVSATLDRVEWQNSALIKGNVAEELTRLKRQPGKDITVLGSATLVRSLLRDGLLDQLQLVVAPIVVGRGKRLFEDWSDRKAMRLVDSKVFGTGVVSLTYQPAGA